jgi:hypothetical protein
VSGQLHATATGAPGKELPVAVRSAPESFRVALVPTSIDVF